MFMLVNAANRVPFSGPLATIFPFMYICSVLFVPFHTPVNIYSLPFDGRLPEYESENVFAMLPQAITAFDVAESDSMLNVCVVYGVPFISSMFCGNCPVPVLLTHAERVAPLTVFSIIDDLIILFAPLKYAPERVVTLFSIGSHSPPEKLPLR